MLSIRGVSSSTASYDFFFTFAAKAKAAGVLAAVKVNGVAGAEVCDGAFGSFFPKLNGTCTELSAPEPVAGVLRAAKLNAVAGAEVCDSAFGSCFPKLNGAGI